jgi:hypothetical protein
MRPSMGTVRTAPIRSPTRISEIHPWVEVEKAWVARPLHPSADEYSHHPEDKIHTCDLLCLVPTRLSSNQIKLGQIGSLLQFHSLVVCKLYACRWGPCQKYIFYILPGPWCLDMFDCCNLCTRGHHAYYHTFQSRIGRKMWNPRPLSNLWDTVCSSLRFSGLSEILPGILCTRAKHQYWSIYPEYNRSKLIGQPHLDICPPHMVCILRVDQCMLDTFPESRPCNFLQMSRLCTERRS